MHYQNLRQVKKIMCAISDYDGTIEMNWVHPDDIREKNLPDWVRGCNSIGNHPARERFADSSITRKTEVKTLTWYSLVQHHNIETVNIIKIDTEGHDHIILFQILNHCKVSNFRPKKIVFESHGEIVANDKELEIICKDLHRIKTTMRIHAGLRMDVILLSLRTEMVGTITSLLLMPIGQTKNR